MGDKTVCLLPALLLLTVPGARSSALMGPSAVTGWERRSLTVQCRYGPGYETYVKWWCRGADWHSCRILVQTSGSEQEVKKGRVSIRDHQKSRTFSVTMEGLRLDDADTYWCGVERTGTDLGVQVEVTVLPATTVSTTTTTTAPVTPGENKVSPTTRNTSAFVLRILPALIMVGLLLILVAASLLVWGLLWRRRTAPGTSLKQASENELYYADLVLQTPCPLQKEASASSPSVARMEVEEEYANVGPPPKEDVSYAALSFGATGQEPIYGNTEHLSAQTPSRAREEALEYSTIRKP